SGTAAPHHLAHRAGHPPVVRRSGLVLEEVLIVETARGLCKLSCNRFHQLLGGDIHQMNKKFWLLVALLVIASLVVACGGSPAAQDGANQAEDVAEEPAAEEPVAEEPAAEEPVAEEPEPSADGVREIRWFIGLGAGSNPEEVEREEAFVELFNEAYGDKYRLVMDVVTNE